MSTPKMISQITCLKLNHVAMRVGLVVTMLCSVPFFMVSSAWGNSYLAMSVDEMTDKADLIFTGTVISVNENVVTPGRMPTNSVNLSVVELLRHRTEVPLSSTSTIAVTFVGKLNNFDPGDRVVLFCVYKPYLGGYRLINSPFSMFRMQSDRGRGYAVYSNWHPSAQNHAHSKDGGPDPLVTIESGHAKFGRHDATPMSEKNFLKVIKKRIQRK
jgi:hypothetical protein